MAFLIRGVSCVAAIGALSAATTTFAQAAETTPATNAPTADDGRLSEIVVTAQRRSERLQDVPIAVNVIGAEALTAKGIGDTRALMNAVPALQFNSSGPAGIPFLRGIGSNDANPNSEPSVATYVDGVYIAAPSANVFALNNVSRIEVLKGPQGTLFGRNATGGVIQIITRDPKPEMALEASVGYENYDRISGALYATGGLASNLSMDLAVQVSHQGDGYGRNLTTGLKTLYNNSYSVRSKLLFTPSSETSIRLAGDFTRNRGNSAEFRVANGALAFDGLPAPANPYDSTGHVLLDGLEHNRVNVDSKGASLTIDQDVSSVKLKSITAYRKVDVFYVIDSDTTPLQIVDGSLPTNQHNVSQEFQLLSGSDSPISYVAGVYLYQSDASYDNARIGGLAAGGGVVVINGAQRTGSVAGYAQATVPIFDGTKFTAGFRYTDERQRFKSSVNGTSFPNQHRGFSKPTWRVALDQVVSQTIHAYVSYNRGIKGGGFDVLSPGTTGFKPEQLDAYEVGLKTELFDRHVRFNISAFRYDYKDIQVQVIDVIGARTSNAAAARIKGVDADFEIRPTSGFSITGGFAVLDGKYRSFANAISYPASPLTGGPTIVDASGNRTINTPKFTANLGLKQSVPTRVGEFTGTINISHNSGSFFAADNGFRQRSYDLLSASLRWTSSNERYSVSFYGNNLLNEYYLVQGVPSAVGDLSVPAAPRTYGIRFGVKY